MLIKVLKFPYKMDKFLITLIKVYFYFVLDLYNKFHVYKFLTGMTLGMQQSTLPVGSVSQTLPMTGMPQTVSMVQQLHSVTKISLHTKSL